MNALVLLLAAALPMFQAQPTAAAAPAAGDKAAKLKALYEQFWEETLQAQPGAGDLPGRPALQRPVAELPFGRRTASKNHDFTEALAEDGAGRRQRRARRARTC